MAFTEDLSAFFPDFGVLATPEAGAALRVIFDKAYLAALGVVASSGPVCVAQSLEVIGLGLTHDSLLTVTGNPVPADDGVYVLAGPPQHDGTGIAVLELRKDA